MICCKTHHTWIL